MSSGGMSLVMKCGKRSFIDHTSSQMKDAVSGILEGWKVPFVVSLSDHIIQLTPISERVRFHFEPFWKRCFCSILRNVYMGVNMDR